MDDASKPGFIISTPTPRNSNLPVVGMMLVPVAAVVDIVKSCAEPTPLPHPSSNHHPTFPFRPVPQSQSVA